MSVPYTIAGGRHCRTWDDFLTLAAQRWALVRDELTSGRLAEHLKRIHAPGPAPPAGRRHEAPTSSSTPGWPGCPPPARVRRSWTSTRRPWSSGQRPGEAWSGQTLRITNVGYRLLRSAARVEASGGGRVRIAPEFPAGAFQTIDQTDVPIEIEVPEGIAGAAPTLTLGAVVIESNGGSRRIEVRLERSPRADSCRKRRPARARST